MAGRLHGLVSHDQSSIPDGGPSCPAPAAAARRCYASDGADLQHGGQLDKLGFVLVGVVLAEQQFGSRRELRPHAGGSAAAVAAISPGQFRTGQSCVSWLLRSSRGSYCLRRLAFRPCSRGCLAGVSCLTRRSNCGGAGWSYVRRSADHARPPVRAATSGPPPRYPVNTGLPSLAEVGFVHLSTRRAGASAGQPALRRAHRSGTAVPEPAPARRAGPVGTRGADGSGVDAVPAPVRAAAGGGCDCCHTLSAGTRRGVPRASRTDGRRRLRSRPSVPGRSGRTTSTMVATGPDVAEHLGVHRADRPPLARCR